MGKILHHPFDSEILEITKGGGPVLVSVGIFLFLLDVVLVGTIVTDQHFGRDSEQLIVVVIMSSIFIMSSIALIFGRYGVTINRQTKNLSIWWGLLVPFYSTKHLVSKFQNVFIASEQRRSKNNTYTVFVVYLRNEETNHKVRIEENVEYLKSRRTAEILAKFLKMQLKDASTDQMVVRNYTELDETVRDRVRRTGKLQDIPELSNLSKIQQKLEGKDIVIQIPKSGWGCVSIALMIFADLILFMFIIFATINIPANIDKPWMDWIPIALPGLVMLIFVGIFGGIAIYLITFHTEIRVSPTRLLVKKISAVSSNIQEIPTNQLEELYISDKNRIGENSAKAEFHWLGNQMLIARSDYTDISFGAGLSPAELKWLLAVIENTVSAE